MSAPEVMQALIRRGRPIRAALLALLLVMVVALAVGGASLGSALVQPTGEDPSVKAAEWARDHGLGPVVTLAESIEYRLHPPAVGGAPDVTVLKGIAAAATTVVHAPMVTPVQPALPGEGRFAAVGGTAHRGDLAITYVRPDRTHTSYLTGVAWMSHDDRFVLHPGYQDPGSMGLWSQPDHVSAADAALLATFNGGFKMKDAEGGFYDHGHVVGQLVPGAASFVVYADGHATVGTWGSNVTMTPDVAFVRQNLKPLIEHGALAADLNDNVGSTWGATVGGDLAVWRSGIGVTATGDLVYVMGDALTVTSLADILHRAGAVNAMQLDINRAWTSFMYYRPRGDAMSPVKLGDFQRPATRYLQPTSRDFIAVLAPRAPRAAGQ